MAYTIEQLRAARQRALNAGDSAAAQELLQASVRLAASQAAPETYDPSEGGGTLRIGPLDTGIKTSQGVERFLAGAGRGMTNVVRHAGNLVGLVDDEDLEEAKRRDDPLMKTGAGFAGSLVGETAILTPVMGAAGAGLGRLGTTGAQLATNPVTRGAVEGLAQGALMADPGEKGEGALLGGVLGAALPLAGKGIKKVAHGLKRTKEAQALLDAGVDLTPGQMNPGGIINQMEESWQSVPGAGAVIRGARENAQNTFQRVVTETAAAPGTKIPVGEADEMLEAAYKSFEPLYDQAKGFPLRLVKGKPAILSTAGPDVPLDDAFAKIVTRRTAPATARRTVAGFLDDQLTKATRSSDDLLDVRSAIRAEARKIRANPNSNVDILARADLLDEAEDVVTKALESQLPQDAMRALRTADSKYGIYKTVEAAVAGARDMPGGFTPARLSQAVAGANRGAGQGAYARGGGGALRDLAAAGTATMNVRSPATGARLAAIGLPVAATMASPAVAIPAGAGMLGMVGTRTGRQLAAGTTSGQKRLAAALARIHSLPQPARGIAERQARALLAASTNE